MPRRRPNIGSCGARGAARRSPPSGGGLPRRARTTARAPILLCSRKSGSKRRTCRMRRSARARRLEAGGNPAWSIPTPGLLGQAEPAAAAAASPGSQPAIERPPPLQRCEHLRGRASALTRARRGALPARRCQAVHQRDADGRCRVGPECRLAASAPCHQPAPSRREPWSDEGAGARRHLEAARNIWSRRRWG